MKLHESVLKKRSHSHEIFCVSHSFNRNMLLRVQVRPREADLASRFLNKDGELHQFARVQDQCETWLDEDFLRLFSGYAVAGGCLPHAILENVLCAAKMLFEGEVVGMVNTSARLGPHHFRRSSRLGGTRRGQLGQRPFQVCSPFLSEYDLERLFGNMFLYDLFYFVLRGSR